MPGPRHGTGPDTPGPNAPPPMPNAPPYGIAPTHARGRPTSSPCPPRYSSMGRIGESAGEGHTMSKQAVADALAALGLGKSRLIKDTTREERKEIIRASLSWCGEGSCENCGSCSLGAGDPYEIYGPYIEGKEEIMEINARIAARRYERLG